MGPKSSHSSRLLMSPEDVEQMHSGAVSWERLMEDLNGERRVKCP